MLVSQVAGGPRNYVPDFRANSKKTLNFAIGHLAASR